MGKIVLFLTLLSIFSCAVPIRTSDWFMGNAGAVPEYKAPQFSEYRILQSTTFFLADIAMADGSNGRSFIP